MAWRLACRADSELVAAISYYGGELPARSDNIAHCPVMAHFGILDASIPEAGARAFAAAQPTVETLFYDADHGFNCDHRAQYDASAATTAWARSLEFFWLIRWTNRARQNSKGLSMSKSESRPQPQSRAQFKMFVPFATRWRDNDQYGHMNNAIYYELFDSSNQ